MAKQKSKATKHLTARVELDVRPDTPSYYVNYMAVGHTDHDFTISAARIPAFLTPERKAHAQKKGIIFQEATLQLVIPPTIIKGLIKALTTQMDTYEKKNQQKAKNGQ